MDIRNHEIPLNHEIMSVHNQQKTRFVITDGFMLGLEEGLDVGFKDGLALSVNN